jgi:hypothetical protein
MFARSINPASWAEVVRASLDVLAVLMLAPLVVGLGLLGLLGLAPAIVGLALLMLFLLAPVGLVAVPFLLPAFFGAANHEHEHQTAVRRHLAHAPGLAVT